MNSTTNTNSHHETLPSETRNDDYTVTCLASRDEMNALGYTVTLCGRRVDKHAEAHTGHAAHAIPCPICRAIAYAPSFRSDFAAYDATHIRPYCGADNRPTKN